MTFAEWRCRLFGHAATVTWPEPWQLGAAPGWTRWVKAVCPRCGTVVDRWIETSEEGVP